jgi:methyl-accepting chemotaxis protein
MMDNIPWARTLGAKLSGIFLVLLSVSVMLVFVNQYMLSSIKGDAAATNQLGLGQTRAVEMLYVSYRAVNDPPELRGKWEALLRNIISTTDQRTRILYEGDPSLGVLPVSDPRALSGLREREQVWRTDIKPKLEQLIGAQSAAEAHMIFARLEQNLPGFTSQLENAVSSYQRVSEEKVEQFSEIQYWFLAIVIVVLLFVFWLGRNIARRVRALALTASRIGDGDLSLVAKVEGSDEVAALATTFNDMTGNLRQLLGAIAETGNSLASASSELLAGTTQQASSAQEQAAAVAETVSTVDEVQQTSEQAAQRAKAVADSAQRAAEIGKTGRQAVEESVAAMASVKGQTESIAESILALAERAQAIGEIIASVNDVAEQTNLLALNAGIEAARAGEHGAGFSVVAREIKDLADQAKKATAQVRQILGEIQKATNNAVMVTEEGSKSVNTTIKTITRAGETIRQLAATIDEAATAAHQITASATQQATGMGQVQQAMRDISQATHQSTAATKQAERAAQDLNALGAKLKELLSA